jgi:hypothetical protein
MRRSFFPLAAHAGLAVIADAGAERDGKPVEIKALDRLRGREVGSRPERDA